MKKVIYFLIITLILGGSAFSQTKQYNLNELVNIAFQNNPQLKANEKTIQAGLKQIDYLDKDYLPQIFFDLNISRWDWVMPNKQKYLGNSLNDLYAAFRVNQLIYDWNKNSLQKEYADKSTDVDRNFTRKLRQAFSYSITKSYLELLKAKRTVQIQEEAINQLKDHLKNAEALYSIGKVSNLDVIKAQVQIEVALDELAKAKNQLEVQKNNINVICGNVLGESFDVVDNIDELWKEYSSKSFSIDELNNILIAKHPDLENIRTQKELRSKEVELFNKEYYPNFYAFGITNVEDSKIPMDHFNWNVGVTVSYSLPFFKGSNFQEKIEQSKIRIDALQENEKAILQQLETNVKNNLVKLEDIKNRLSGTQKIVKLAEESLTTANLKYNIGKGSSLDVLDAETVLTTAKLNLNQIVIDYLSTIAELNYNIGSDEIPFK
ncbi:TolC family protein [Melioribacteraceae bacterium 4301-Me]|uniref:TolC family protein n=1 Tax=Pyranulibacter aquaticus TaxID=3163344 RepID=UPI00359B2BAB